MGANEGAFALDCNSLTNSSALVQLSLIGSPVTSNNAGLLWDETNNRLVMTDGSSTLRYCTPPSNITDSWVWTEQIWSGDAVEQWYAPAGRSIWGRFMYVHEIAPEIASPGYRLILGSNTHPAFFKL